MAILHPVDDELGMARSVVALLDDPARARAIGDARQRRARHYRSDPTVMALSSRSLRRLALAVAAAE
jgi:ABC-type nitrate/sulfonate/bicarbonate transport system ATPase subunit